MALTFPLALTDFWDILPMASVVIDPTEMVQTSITGSGEVTAAEIGPRLWRGTAVFGAITKSEAAAIEPLLSVARGAAATFYAYDTRFPEPQAQPQGVLTPSILSLAVNSRELALTGLVDGFTLKAGDYLSFQYGSSPVRFAFHRIVTPVTVADVSGDTAEFEVTPNIRPGAVVSTAVVLSKPFFKARMLPGTFSPGSRRRLITEGMSFSFMQSLN